MRLGRFAEESGLRYYYSARPVTSTIRTIPLRILVSDLYNYRVPNACKGSVNRIVVEFDKLSFYSDGGATMN